MTPIVIPLRSGFYQVHDLEVEYWQAVYPRLNCRAEILRAASWALVNKPRRKTERGVGRFIRGWLDRASTSYRRPGQRADDEVGPEVKAAQDRLRAAAGVVPGESPPADAVAAWDGKLERDRLEAEALARAKAERERRWVLDNTPKQVRRYGSAPKTVDLEGIRAGVAAAREAMKQARRR